MKKILIMLILCIISITSFGQLHTQTIEEYEGYKNVYSIVINNSYLGNVRYYDSYGYYLFGKTDNQFEKSMANIALGPNKESAIIALNDLKNLAINGFDETLVVKAIGNKATYLYCPGKCFNVYSIIIETDGIMGKSGVINVLYYKKWKILEEIINAIQNFENNKN